MKKFFILLLSLEMIMLVGCSDSPEKEEKPVEMIEVTLQLVDISGEPIRKHLYYSIHHPTGVHDNVARYTSTQGQLKKTVAVGVEYVFEVEGDPEKKELVFDKNMDSKVIPIQVNLPSSKQK